MRFDLFADGEDRTGIVLGTGPSLQNDLRRVIACRASHKCRLFGCNITYQHAPLDVHLACNYQFWDYYWPRDEWLRVGAFAKWTTRPESARKYGINYIEERWEPGLSTDPAYICAHHGSGPQILGLALHYGCERILLVGWDMRYSGKVSDREYQAPRHYFGEYPPVLGHWPRTGPQGELAGLIREMETIHPEDYGVEIINCTPGSAMTHFRIARLQDVI